MPAFQKKKTLVVKNEGDAETPKPQESNTYIPEPSKPEAKINEQVPLSLQSPTQPETINIQIQQPIVQQPVPIVQQQPVQIVQQQPVQIVEQPVYVQSNEQMYMQQAYQQQQNIYQQPQNIYQQPAYQQPQAMYQQQSYQQQNVYQQSPVYQQPVYQQGGYGQYGQTNAYGQPMGNVQYGNQNYNINAWE